MKRLATFAIAALLVASSAIAQQPQESPAGHYFKNLTLLDQNGKPVDLYNDVMKGHVVVINTFFTSCTGSCPIMAGSFQTLQKEFAPQLGKELHLISISVDPAHDTPQKLREWAKRMNAKPGWHFFTGTKEQVDAALRKFGQYTETREGHMNVILVGNDTTGLWKKLFGLAKPQDIATSVKSVLEDKGGA